MTLRKKPFEVLVGKGENAGNDLRKKPFENIVGTGENAGNQHFLLFPTMFSILSKTEIII